MKEKQTPAQGETWPSQGTGELRKMAALGKDVGIISGSTGVYGVSIKKRIDSDLSKFILHRAHHNLKI